MRSADRFVRKLAGRFGGNDSGVGGSRRLPHEVREAVAALETPAEHPFVQQVSSAASAVAGSSQLAGVRYNTNASHYGPAGIPCVVFGPGSIRQAHSALEYVEIREVELAVAILRRLMEGSVTSL